MKNLWLAISLFGLLQVATAQEHKWGISVKSGIMIMMDAGNLSSYTPYFDGYGKVPNDIPGFEYDSSSLSPNSGSAAHYPLSLILSYQINKRLSMGLKYSYYFILNQGYYSQRSGQIDGDRYEIKKYFVKKMHSFFITASYVFSNPDKPVTWHINPLLGTTFWHIKNGYYLHSDIVAPGFYNGTAEDYIERSDWAFTYGLALGCTYAIGTHWGISIDAQLATFNLKPESATRYSYKIDGEELVETLTTREQQFIFTDDFPDRPDEPLVAQVLPPENYRYFVPQFTLGVGYSF